MSKPSPTPTNQPTQQEPINITQYVLTLSQELQSLCLQMQQQQQQQQEQQQQYQQHHQQQQQPVAAAATAAVHTPKPKVGAPDPFSGEKDKINIFLTLCENTFTTHPSAYRVMGQATYNSQARVSFAASYLRGAAMAWWISLQKVPNHPATVHWSQFRQGLCDQFDDPQRTCTTCLALETLQHTTTIAAYTQQFCELSLYANLSEGDLLIHY
jgi:hypothetical protein